MDDPRELEYLKNYKPSISDLNNRSLWRGTRFFNGHEWNRAVDTAPRLDRKTKFLSIEVEVDTPLGIGKGVYNYMDDNWLVELYGNEHRSDELQSYTGVTHWRDLDWSLDMDEVDQIAKLLGYEEESPLKEEQLFMDILNDERDEDNVSESLPDMAH